MMVCAHNGVCVCVCVCVFERIYFLRESEFCVCSRGLLFCLARNFLYVCVRACVRAYVCIRVLVVAVRSFLSLCVHALCMALCIHNECARSVIACNLSPQYMCACVFYLCALCTLPITLCVCVCVCVCRIAAAVPFFCFCFTRVHKLCTRVLCVCVCVCVCVM